MKRLYIFLFLLSVSATVWPQLDRSKPPLPSPAPEIKIGGYEKFQLPNGLKVFVVENHQLPVVSLSLSLDLDPILEGGNAGYIDIAGELLRTGTKTRTKDKLDEEIDFIGAQLSTSATGVYASSLKKHLPKLLDIMSDVIVNPDFKQEEFDKIKKQTLAGLQAAKDEPAAIANRIVQTLYFGKNHPYGEIVTEESVNNITLGLCKEYYNKYFKPNVGYLAIVGDITKKEIEPLLKKYFGKWKKAAVKNVKYPAPIQPSENRVAIVDRPNSVQSTIRIGYPVDLKIGSDDIRKASLANTILGGGVFRLFENLREKHAFTYGAYSKLNPDQIIGSFTASTEVRNIATDSAITEIFFEMNRIKNEKVSETELQKAKNYVSGSFSISLEDPATVARFATNIEKYKLPKDYYKDYLKTTAAINSDDIQYAAQKYIHPDNSFIIVVGNASELADKLKKFNPSGKIEYYDIYGNKYDPSVSTIPVGVTTETVLDNYVKAVGGKENIIKIKDITTKMTGTMQGMTLGITVSIKDPDKLAQTISVGGMDQKVILNNGKGITITPMGKNELTGNMLEDIKGDANIKAFLDYSQAGIKTTLKGTEKVNGKDLYKIEFLTSNGSKYYEYYDPETGLKIRQLKSITSPSGPIEQTSDYSDYREVNGVKFPFKIIQKVGPQTVEINVSSININQNLEDKLFEIEK